MLPLPFWSLLSPCCNSRGPAGCSQPSWSLCVLQAPGALLCTVPSCSPRALFPKTSFWPGLVAPSIGNNVPLPKMATWQWQSPFKGSYCTDCTGNKQVIITRRKTENLCLFKRCCRAYLILKKNILKHNSDRALIHNLLYVFYKKAEKCFCISRLFPSIVLVAANSDVLLPSTFVWMQNHIWNGIKTSFKYPGK